MNYYSIHGLTLEKLNIGPLNSADPKEVSNILFHGLIGQVTALKNMSHVKSIKHVLLMKKMLKWKIFNQNDLHLNII
jgi:hypothetical protein